MGPAPEVTDDAEAIAQAFHEARARLPARPPRFWWATALTVAAALSVAAGLVFAARAPSAPLRPDASERAAPPPSGAFAAGGKPSAGEAALRRAFAADAPGYFVALDRWASARRDGSGPAEVAEAERALDEARDRALAPDVRQALGEGAAPRLEALLATARVAAAGDADAGSASDDAFFDALGALDDALAAAGLGYFVDGDILADRGGPRRLTLAYFFEVERVVVFASGERRVRALEIRRIDHLNWTHTLLGFTRPHLSQALVMLDAIDQQLSTYLVPGLGEGAAVDIQDADEEPAPPWAAAVRARAGEIVREEYGALPGLDREAATTLGRLAARRRALFASWQVEASKHGLTIQQPTRLLLATDAAALRPLVPHDQLEELVSVDRALGEPRLDRVYGVLRDALGASIARHEVQHRLDLATRGERPMPAALEELVGPAYHDGKERTHALSARDELSAYLAELARDERTTRVNLGRLTRFLFDPRMAGTPECYAALVIVDGLEREVGGARPSAGPAARIFRGKLDREAIAASYLALTQRPATELAAAAEKLWERLFDGPLPPLAEIGR